MTLEELSRKLDGYHDDVKRRLELVEDQNREFHRAINGEAGNDAVPGLHVQVVGLIGFRERIRLGVGMAWALILTIITIIWKKS